MRLKTYWQVSIMVLCLISSSVAYAQEGSDATEAVATTEPTTEDGNLKIGLGLEAGTHALGGISLVALYKERFGLRVGYNNMTFNRDGILVTYSNTELSNDIAIDRSHLFVAADIGLIGKGAVRLVTGVGIMTGNSISLTSKIQGERRINDIVLSPERVGVITTEISSASNANYYIGIGFGRAVPRKRIGFNFDIGGFYMGDLNLDMQATNLLRHNTGLQPQLEEDINTLTPWWPAMSFRLNIKLK
jgi:hypothetical protein